MPHTLSAQIAFGIYVAVCSAILVLGDRNGKIAGAAMLVQVILDNLLHDHVHGGPQYWSAGFDVVLLIVLGTIAYFSKRIWPLWATAFQLISTLTHGIKAIDPSVHGWAYLSASTLFGWFTIVAVFAGSVAAFSERRRERRFAP